MCWGAGILLSSGVVRAVAGIDGDLAWRLPFALQWIWPLPLFIAAYLAPESPWNAIRRNKPELARQSLMRLLPNTDDKAQRVEYTLAYIKYTTELERAETSGARFIDCFRGTNARRTEIVGQDSIFCRKRRSIICQANECARIVSFGLLKSYAATRSLGSRSSFLNPQDSVPPKPSMLIYRSRLATSLAA